MQEGVIPLDRLAPSPGWAARIEDGVLVCPPGPEGAALFASGIVARGGIHRVSLDAEVGAGADPGTWPELDVFDAGADCRVYASHRVSGALELFVRVYATERLELRLFTHGAACTLRGLAFEPVLLDHEPADADRLRVLALRLQAARAEPAAIYRLVDRLKARGADAAAESLAQACVARSRGPQAWIHATLRRVHGAGAARAVGGEAIERPSDAAIASYLWSRSASVFDLFSLNADARDALAARGYATDFLQATRLHRQGDEPGRHWWERARAADPPEPDPPRQPLFERHVDIDRSYQAAIARGEGMTAYDPVDGTLRRAHHGFLIHFCDLPFVFYRFEGVEVFYVCTGHISSPRTFIYLPATETIVLIGDPWYRNYQAVDLVKRLNTDLVRHADLVGDYLGSPTRPAAVIGSNIHGHFFWNDLSGLDYALGRGLIDGLAELVRVDRQFVDPRAVFPELAGLPSPYFADADAAFRHAMTTRLLPVHFTDDAMRPHLIARLRAAAERAAPDAGPPAEAPRPLIWINLRRHNKVWVDQAQGYASLLNALRAQYGEVSAYVDGMADCAAIFAEIRALTDPAIPLYDGLHPDTFSTLQWAWRVDAYVAVIGSSLMMVNAMADRRGVAHAEHAHLEQMAWWATVRPGLTPPLTPARAQVTEIGEGLYTDYKVDWRVLLRLLRRVLADEGVQPVEDDVLRGDERARFFTPASPTFHVHPPTRLEGAVARAPAGAVDQLVTGVIDVRDDGVHILALDARALGGRERELAWRVLVDDVEKRFEVFHEDAVAVLDARAGARIEVQVVAMGAEAIVEGLEVRPLLLDAERPAPGAIWDAIDQASALGAPDELIARLRERLA